MMKETDLTLIWLVDDDNSDGNGRQSTPQTHYPHCDHRGDVYMLQKALKTCIVKLLGLSVGFDLCLL